MPVYHIGDVACACAGVLAEMRAYALAARFKSCFPTRAALRRLALSGVLVVWSPWRQSGSACRARSQGFPQVTMHCRPVKELRQHQTGMYAAEPTLSVLHYSSCSTSNNIRHDAQSAESVIPEYTPASVNPPALPAHSGRAAWREQRKGHDGSTPPPPGFSRRSG